MVGDVRESSMGGIENSAEIEDLGRFAVDEHNKQQNTLLEFARVVKVKEQVVAGTMYYLTVEAIEGGEKKLYEAKVWVKPWLNFKELQEFTPLADSSSGATAAGLGAVQEFPGIMDPEEVSGMVGGIQEGRVGENDAEIEELGRFAVDEHNKQQNTLLEFARVVKVKEQVVAGTMYYLTVEAIEGGKKKLYEAKVWVKPWLNFKELQEFTPLADSSSGATAAGLGAVQDD